MNVIWAVNTKITLHSIISRTRSIHFVSRDMHCLSGILTHYSSSITFVPFLFFVSWIVIIWTRCCSTHFQLSFNRHSLDFTVKNWALWRSKFGTVNFRVHIGFLRVHDTSHTLMIRSTLTHRSHRRWWIEFIWRSWLAGWIHLRFTKSQSCDSCQIGLFLVMLRSWIIFSARIKHGSSHLSSVFRSFLICESHWSTFAVSRNGSLQYIRKVWARTWIGSVCLFITSDDRLYILIPMQSKCLLDWSYSRWKWVFLSSRRWIKTSNYHAFRETSSKSNTCSFFLLSSECISC